MGKTRPISNVPPGNRALIQDLPASAPSQIAHYQLHRVLGRGGMGVVYEAVHLHLKRRVAIKLLLDSDFLDAGRRQRFDREIEAIGRLRHPHVVAAHDAGTDSSGHRYLVMEFVDGRDLQAVATHSGAMSLADACECIRQAALGLGYAHRSACVHRDVKPSNLLLDREGTVRVSDLGLARLQSSAAGDSLTGTGQVLGTADYMSPEQAQGDREIGAASDIYSLGCTFFRLLAGRVPYHGSAYDTLARKLLAHVEESLPRIGDFCHDIPPEIAELLDEMTAKDAAVRPTADEVAARLAKFSVGANLAKLLAGLPAVEAAKVVDFSTAPARSTGRLASLPTRRLKERRPRGFMLASILSVVAVSAIGIWGITRPWGSRPIEPDSLPGNSPPNLNALPTSPPASVPVERFYEDLKSTEIQPHIGYPLLNKQPEKIFWSTSPLAQVQHLPELKQVTATCPDAGFLLLGSAPRVGYTLQIDIFQNRWSNNVGIFFGLQPMAEMGPNGERQWRVQGLYLNDRTGLRDADKIPLSFTRVKWIIRVKDDGTTVFQNHDLVGAYLPTAGIRPKQLEVTVNKHGLTDVRWGGDAEPFANVCGADVNGEFVPADYCGGFGIYIRRSEGTFRNARISFEPEPYIPP
jgi:eukaryotic-like serine/threonine-protein kinase